MESTYGDRSHGPRPDYVGELSRILQRTFDRGGNVVIPSFAVGRTQELLYFIREIKKEGLVTGHGNFPVYIDSPLAIEATRIFKDTDLDCFDEDTRALLAQGIDPIQFQGLQVSVTSDESRMINADRVPRSSSRPAACARQAASATTSSTICGGRSARSFLWAIRPWERWAAP